MTSHDKASMRVPWLCSCT